MGNASITLSLYFSGSIMPTVTSKLTSKYQATIPKSVRDLLHINAGDNLAFDIKENRVCLRKATPIDLSFAEALTDTLSEWNSVADEKAYYEL